MVGHQARLAAKKTLGFEPDRPHTPRFLFSWEMIYAMGQDHFILINHPLASFPLQSALRQCRPGARSTVPV